MMTLTPTEKKPLRRRAEMAMQHSLKAGLVATAVLWGIVGLAQARVDVEPPGATVAGKTIGEWSANWWQWAAALAPPGDPLSDASGQYASVNQSGPVFFLAGSPGGVHSRRFMVPAGSYVLIPLLAGESSQLELGFDQSAAQIRQAAQLQANNIDSLHATLDGTAIAQATLFNHREVSPDFAFVAVANNQVGIFGVGPSGIAVADGYFLMLEPLTPGTHVLNYGGGLSAASVFVDETDTITVLDPAAQAAVVPPGATVAGKTIGEWSVAWWQWAAALAPPGDPFTDTTGQYADVSQSGPVFFLAGSPRGSNSRQFDMPTNAYVLIPLLVGELSQLELGFDKTEEDIRQAAKAQADLIDSLHATLDGAFIPSAALFAHREVSPPFSFVAAANNQVGIPAGNSGIAIADGYFLMLGPLSYDTHVLSYGARLSSLGISIDETDTINPPTPPGFTSFPQSLTVDEGQPVTFTIRARGSRPLSYEWTRNGQVLLGVAGDTLTLPSARVSDMGAYTARVSNFLGWAISPVFFLTVNAVPVPSISIASDPAANEVRLSWPTNSVGFALQSTTNLDSPGSWTDHTNALPVMGVEFVVTNAISGPSQFYRLRKP
jgi:hypothetical protein